MLPLTLEFEKLGVRSDPFVSLTLPDALKGYLEFPVPEHATVRATLLTNFDSHEEFLQLVFAAQASDYGGYVSVSNRNNTCDIYLPTSNAALSMLFQTMTVLGAESRFELSAVFGEPAERPFQSFAVPVFEGWSINVIRAVR